MMSCIKKLFVVMGIASPIVLDLVSGLGCWPDGLFHVIGFATGLQLTVPGGVDPMLACGSRPGNLPVMSVEGASSMIKCLEFCN